jgi:hypothetical protein
LRFDTDAVLDRESKHESNAAVLNELIRSRMVGGSAEV